MDRPNQNELLFYWTGVLQQKADVTVILWKVINQVGKHDLLLQQVFLIKEEDDGGALEPGISDDGPEQSFALLHTILTGNGGRESREYC